MSGNRYCIEYAKRSQASCKKCKQKIEKCVVRIAKLVPNPFSDTGGDMKQWFHVPCIFETLSRARATTKKIEDPGDLEGWDDIEPDDRKVIMKHINGTLFVSIIFGIEFKQLSIYSHHVKIWKISLLARQIKLPNPNRARKKHLVRKKRTRNSKKRSPRRKLNRNLVRVRLMVGFLTRTHFNFNFKSFMF